MNNVAQVSLTSLTISSLALALLGIGCTAPTSLPDDARGITRSSRQHQADQERFSNDEEEQEQSVLAITEDPSDEAAMEEEMTVVMDEPAIEDTYSDDSGRCGNGVLDVDELCDVAIEEGEEGACVTECVAFDICHKPAIALRGCWTQCVLGEELPC